MVITAGLTGMANGTSTSLLAGVRTAEQESEELLADRGFPDSKVVLVRSAGDTLSRLEEIWFRDQYGRRMSATLVPQERKPMNGREVKWTKVEIEYGW